MQPFPVRRLSAIGLLACACLVLAVALASGQARQRTTSISGVPALDPPTEPVVLYSNDVPRIRVVPIVTGLSHPWGLAFRRNGDILVTERNEGALRLIRDGVLDPRPIPGVPEVYKGTRLAGLMDIALHPEDDRLVYLTYSRPAEQDGRRGAVIALARGRLDAGALTEVRDIFVSEGFGRGVAASRVTFGPDGKVYMTIGGAIRSGTTGLRAQDPGEHVGKVVRLNDDGSAPADNPFVGEPGYLPEIYSMGHRNQIGLTFHPDNGTLWASENAPQGATRSTSSSPAGTTAGQLPPTAGSTRACGCRTRPGSRSSNDRRSCGGRRSRRRASPSTTASTSPPGAATSLSAR